MTSRKRNSTPRKSRKSTRKLRQKSKLQSIKKDITSKWEKIPPNYKKVLYFLIFNAIFFYIIQKLGKAAQIYQMHENLEKGKKQLKLEHDRENAKLNTKFDTAIENLIPSPPPKYVNLYKNQGMKLSDLNINSDMTSRSKIFELLRSRPDTSGIYVHKKVLGQGMYGRTFLSCVDSRDNCEYVLKEATDIDTTVNEIFALLDIADKMPAPHFHVAPKIFDFYAIKYPVALDFKPFDKVCIVMEKLQKCNDMEVTLWDKLKAGVSPIPFGPFAKYTKELELNVKDLAKKAESVGWLHMDLHPGNIMCRFNGDTRTFVLIDWGLSCNERDDLNNHPWREHLITVSKLNPLLPNLLKLKGVDLDDMKFEGARNWFRFNMRNLNQALVLLGQKRRKNPFWF